MHLPESRHTAYFLLLQGVGGGDGLVHPIRILLFRDLNAHSVTTYLIKYNPLGKGGHANHLYTNPGLISAIANPQISLV